MILRSLVRDLSHKGLGVIDHTDGRVFYVRGVWPGDEVEVEITPEQRKYDTVELVRLLRLGPHRIPALCPHRGPAPGECGGCPWMIADYEDQLRFKVKRLLHSLEKRGLRDIPFSPIIPAPSIYSYRNRAQFKTNGREIGYVSEGTNVLAPVDDCLILNDQLRSLFKQLRSTLPREDFTPAEGFSWNYLDVDDEMVLSDLRLNRRRPFRQGNTEQNERMKGWLRSQLETIDTLTPVIDLFCGSGNFTEVFSELGFSNILAVEVQGSALEELSRKKLPGVRIHPQDILEKGSWSKIARALSQARLMLVDPPREGIPKRRSMLKYLDRLDTIFYISCEIETFSRDAADLLRSGWVLDSLTPLDLFPHTPHVEVLSVFRKLDTLSKGSV